MCVSMILESLELVSGRLEKEAILKANISDETLKKAFLYALDPYRTYGIAKVSTIEGLNTCKSLPDIFAVLDSLSTRELSGNAARDEVNSVLSCMPLTDMKWAARIALKNLRCGVSETTVNKIWPGLVPTFEVQLAEVLELEGDSIDTMMPAASAQRHLRFPLWADAKLDGLRCIALKEDGIVSLRSRNGQVFENFPSIAAAVEALDADNFALDGEVMGSNWNDTQSVAFSKKAKTSDKDLVLNVFDVVRIEEWRSQKSMEPYGTRQEVLCALVLGCSTPDKIRLVPGHVIENIDDLTTAFREFLDLGYEGLMVKDLKAPYCFGRSKAVRKAKPVSTHDGRVVGFFEGKGAGKRAGGLGGFFVKLPNGAVTRVGGGFTDAQLKEFWDAGEAAMKGRIVEVAGQFLTDDGKIRFPRFLRFREASDVAPEVNAIEV